MKTSDELEKEFLAVEKSTRAAMAELERDWRTAVYSGDTEQANSLHNRLEAARRNQATRLETVRAEMAAAIDLELSPTIQALRDRVYTQFIEGGGLMAEFAGVWDRALSEAIAKITPDQAATIIKRRVDPGTAEL